MKITGYSLIILVRQWVVRKDYKKKNKISWKSHIRILRFSSLICKYGFYFNAMEYVVLVLGQHILCP